MVALRDYVEAVFRRAALGRRGPLCVHLPSYMAGGPPVWRAGSGCSPGHLCSSRTYSGLLDYGEVSGVGLLRARDCTRAGDFYGVRPPWEPGTRDDADCRRTCRDRSAGPQALGKRLVSARAAIR